MNFIFSSSGSCHLLFVMSQWHYILSMPFILTYLYYFLYMLITLMDKSTLDPLDYHSLQTAGPQ